VEGEVPPSRPERGACPHLQLRHRLVAAAWCTRTDAVGAPPPPPGKRVPFGLGMAESCHGCFPKEVLAPERAAALCGHRPECRQLYFSGFSVPDPFIAIGLGRRKIGVFNALEYGRAMKESNFDEVLPLEDWHERAKRRFGCERPVRSRSSPCWRGNSRCARFACRRTFRSAWPTACSPAESGSSRRTGRFSRSAKSRRRSRPRSWPRATAAARSDWRPPRICCAGPRCAAGASCSTGGS